MHTHAHTHTHRNTHTSESPLKSAHRKQISNLPLGKGNSLVALQPWWQRQCFPTTHWPEKINSGSDSIKDDIEIYTLGKAHNISQKFSSHSVDFQTDPTQAWLTMAFLHLIYPFIVSRKIIKCFLLGDQWWKVLGFVPTCSVSSS